MNNLKVKESLELCNEELRKINEIIDRDKFNSANNYLTKYCLIKASGTIEQAFKDIIVDFISSRSDFTQFTNYVDKKIKKSSMNPSFENMNKLLKDFDEEWSNKFKLDIRDRVVDDGNLKSSLESLNTARNSFAHGLDTTITIGEIRKYFNHASIIIEIYDGVVYSS